MKLSQFATLRSMPRFGKWPASWLVLSNFLEELSRRKKYLETGFGYLALLEACQHLP